MSRELVEKFSKRTMQIERLARDSFTKVDARAGALIARADMKDTGLDYADAYAKIKHDLGAESREKKSTATLGHDAQVADWRAQMTQEELQSLTHASVRMAWSQGLIQEDKAGNIVKAIASTARVDCGPTGGLVDGEEAAYALDQTRCADVAPCALCATQRRVEQQRVVALRIIAGAGRGGMNPQVFSSPPETT